MPRWLLVGALHAETLPLMQLLGQPRPRGTRLVEGWLGACPVVVLTCGVGPARAERRTRAALRHLGCDAVVSLGTCGALVDDLEPGTLVWASATGTPGQPARPLRPPIGGGLPLATVPRVVADPTRRVAMRAQGYAVCDMEADAVRTASAARPFFALKVVSDRAGADADADLVAGRLPSPLRVARFQVRAYHLVQRALAPALADWLQGAPGLP